MRALVIGLVLLAAQTACAGLKKYSALVVADADANATRRGAIRVTYLGVNGYQFETGGHVLLVDPYFSRVGFWPVAFNRKIDINQERIAGGLAHLRSRADAILVTHAHFDHLLDVPEIVRRTGGRLLAGPTAIQLAQECGVPERECGILKPGSRQTIGPWTIRVLSAQHDRLFGRVPFEGKARSNGPPVKASDWVVGEPLAFVIEAAGRRIYIDSGGVPGAPPDAAVGHVDLAILGVALPDSRRRFAEVVRQLRPRFILPSHQDDFFRPAAAGFVFAKLSNFPQLLRIREKEKLPGQLILLDYFRPWTLP
jgi:L-ascorbate metabolism protein UlaG (beta-lactamase superfamily)